MVGVILQLHRQLRVDQVVLEVEQLDVLLFQVVLVTLVVLIHPKVMQVVKELMFLLIIMILVDQVVEQLLQHLMVVTVELGHLIQLQEQTQRMLVVEEVRQDKVIRENQVELVVVERVQDNHQPTQLLEQLTLVVAVVELEVQEHQIIQEQVVQVSWSQDHLSLVLHFQQVLDVIQFH